MSLLYESLLTGSMDEISKAIGEVSFAQPSAADATHIQAVFDEVNRQLSRYTLKQVLNKDENFKSEKIELNDLPMDEQGENA